MTQEITLRAVEVSDIGVFFEHQIDPVAIQMMAFPSTDPTDRAAFVEKWSGILGDRTVAARTVVVAGRVAGYVVSFDRLGRREVGYWIGRDSWGKGVATGALRSFLDEFSRRPLHARTSKDHLASLRVLAKCGFVVVAEETSANAQGEQIEEFILELR
jgi:RimJ/RimL family protein N-acetyltransferase